MRNKNAFSTLLAVLITAVIVGVLTGVISYSYAVFKNKDTGNDELCETAIKEPETNIPQTKNIKPVAVKNTSEENWKTYNNEKYGFKIKYPDKEWEVQNINKTGDAIEIGFKIDDKPSFGATIYITGDNPKKLPINQYVDEMLREIKEGGATFSYQSKEEVAIGSNKGVRIGLVKDPLYKDGIDQYYISNQENIFEINRPPESKIPSSEKTMNETLDQILSTFQFTK